jgi:hypothetical protein
MNRLMDLPDELLDEIVLCVSATSFEAVPNLGQTCRRLQRICRPLQWKHMVLPWRLNENASIAKFIERHAGNDNIRSIRLQPQPAVLTAFKIGMNNAFGHIDALCDILASLSKLTTFSIFLDKQVDTHCSLPGVVLARIVRSLPPSLNHLELDTEGVDRIANSSTVQRPEDHLCLAISEHMPHLETLRVRLSCICTDLFHSLSVDTAAQTTSRLRRAFIRLDSDPNEGHSLDSETEGNCKVHRHAAHHNRRHAILDRADFNTRISELQTAGAFPQLERFIWFSWKHDFQQSIPRCKIHDFATRSITSFLRLETTLGDWYIPELYENYSTTVWIIRNHDHEDLVGDQRALEASLLHEVLWEDRGDGVRFPPVERLESREFRLRTGNLTSLDYLRKLRGEGMGVMSFIPHMSHLAGQGVIVTEM